MILRQALGLLITALFLKGCVMAPRGDWPQRPEGLPPRSEITSVPFFGQEEYQCGPASLAMVLAWSGLAVKPEELTPIAYTPSRRGSLQPDMIAAARRLGRIAYVISGAETLVREVAAGHPVIVLQNLGLSWFPVWHYAVVIGFDAAADEILLHTGLSPRERTSFRVFQNTWSRSDDWGLLVLKPDRLPATAEEGKFIESVIILEKIGSTEAAAEGYMTALRRWPLNLTAMMGLGNSRYASGDLAGSAEAFRRAIEAHPESGSAFNNLAHVLSAQGKKAEALEAARQAVERGGPLKETYEKTLREIRSAPSP